MSRRASPRELAARALVLGLLGRIRDGAVIVHEGGKRQLCGRPVAGERVPEVKVRSPNAWRAAAADGSAGLGRAYFSGWWSTETLDELTTFLRVLIRNLEAIEPTGAWARHLGAPFRRLLRRAGDRTGDPGVPAGPGAPAGTSPVAGGVPGGARGGRGADGRIPGLGGELFALFLGETMNCSSGLFASPATDLRTAQVAKLDRLCRKLSVGPEDHLLEIGAGLGSFALHAASRHGCRVTTTTTSPGQQGRTAARVKDAGLEDLVTVVEQDFRGLSGTFDKIVAVETPEAFDWHEHEELFASCARLLVPEGLLALQAVVVADQRFRRSGGDEDFVRRYVLPGSCLPSIGSIVESATRASDLRLVALDDIGQHDAETFRRWREAFAGREAELAGPDLDETLARLFEFSLCYCEAAFAERLVGDVQCVLARSRWRPGRLSLPTA